MAGNFQTGHLRPRECYRTVLTRELAGGMKWRVTELITVSDGGVKTHKVSAIEGGCSSSRSSRANQTAAVVITIQLPPSTERSFPKHAINNLVVRLQLL